MEKKIKILIGILVIIVVSIGGWWVWNNYFRVIENVTNPEQALIIAKRTPEAREFMRLYPDADVNAGESVIMGGVAQGWDVSFIKNPNIYPNIVSLGIHVNDNGTIDYIFPENVLNLIKDKKYCKTDNDCLSVECPSEVEYVNYIHAYADKCTPKLSIISNTWCHSYFISSCINHECYGNDVKVEIPTQNEALKIANETKKAKEFLKLHPDATVSIEKFCCVQDHGDWIWECEKNPDFRGWSVFYKKDADWANVRICPIQDAPGFRNFD